MRSYNKTADAISSDGGSARSCETVSLSSSAMSASAGGSAVRALTISVLQRKDATSYLPAQLPGCRLARRRVRREKASTHWLGLYESASDRIRQMFDEKFVRMWRLYLAG